MRNDPFLTVPAEVPIRGPAKQPMVQAASGRRTVRSELARLYHKHAIAQTAYRGYLVVWSRALTAAGNLTGTRATELAGVIANLRTMAADGAFTGSRLPALFLTLERNRQWWTTGPLLSFGDRVEFKGSPLIWEYYPGEGIELTELGNFGKVDGYYTGGHRYWTRMRKLLDVLIPLAARRAHGIAWEYYFDFDGGVPPWTSGMSQGTALQALSDAYKAFKDRSYLQVAKRALPVFSAAPPTGVGVKTRLGRRYLLYSFAPGAAVLNGFLQTLIGLYAYARVSHNPTAKRLFAEGDAEARHEVPSYDTGAWSLYQPGEESDLSYHELVTGFLHKLCSRTHARVYCVTAQHFDAYLKTPPALTLLTTRLAARTAGAIKFRLSKISHVGIVVLRGAQTVFETSASFAYGVHAFAVPALGKGRYTVRLAATDLAGNFSRIIRQVQVGR